MSEYTQLAKDIIDNVGGKENVKSLRHCITRLRFVLNNESLANTDYLKSRDGIITVVQASGQYQVVIGNEVSDVHDEIQKQLDQLTANGDDPIVEEENKTNLLDKFVNFISQLFQPFLGPLAAAGMIKGIVAILGSFGMTPANSGFAAVLNMAGDGFFQFLPVMLAVTASRVLDLNIFSALGIVSALLYPTIGDLASGEVLYTLFANTVFESDIFQTFLGIPIILPPGGYMGTIIPIIIAVWFGSRVEKKAKQIVPRSLQTFFVPFIVLIVAVPVSILLIGPVASWAASLIGVFFSWLYQLNTVIFGILVGGLWQVLVMFGLHWGLIPIAILQVVDQGYTPIFGASDVAWASVMGVLIAVFIKTKNSKTKELTLPAAISSFFGVTEPGVYGILLPNKILFIISLIAAGIGGGYSGFFNVVPYRMGGLGIFSLASYIPNDGVITMNVWHRIISFVLTFVIAFIITMMVKVDKKADAEVEVVSETVIEEQSKPEAIYSPLDGEVIPLADVDDPVFSSGMMGKGVAIIPSDGIVYAPTDGEVVTLFPTGHAIGIQSDLGHEILIHIGINTVELEGQGFKPLIVVGDKITQGQPLIEVNIALLKERGFSTTTPIIITNAKEDSVLTIAQESQTKAKSELFTIE